LRRKRSVNAGRAANATRRADGSEEKPCLHRFGERPG